MDTFEFDYHIVAIKHELVDTKMQMGDGWTFVAEGDSPDIRSFELAFQGFQYYYDENGDYDATTNQYINNMKALETFFLEHRTYKHFIYPLHDGAENVIVRFNEPLSIPKGIRGGGGAVEPFTVKFIERV